MEHGRNDTDEVTEVNQPDFAKMRSIFVNDIKPSEEHSAKARGEASAAWKAIEDDCNCNKRAAKQLFRLFNESEETREDFLRTLIGGLVALEMLPREDLVDMMGEKNVPDVDAIARPPRRPRGLGTEGMPGLQ